MPSGPSTPTATPTRTPTHTAPSTPTPAPLVYRILGGAASAGYTDSAGNTWRGYNDYTSDASTSDGTALGARRASGDVGITRASGSAAPT